MTVFEKTTKNIQVLVEPNYEDKSSKPERSLFVFSYHVIIKNNGDTPIQIYKRSWTITDAFSNIECIEGEGIVGKQPVINPGESFSYTSFCPLKTNFGAMKGQYSAITDAGKNLKIDIPEFILAYPFAIQ